MSEQIEQEPTKITAQEKEESKQKDPKRVAQGKRLAQISKEAKEKKMREKIEQESKIDFSVNYNTLLYFGIPSIVFAGMYLYFSSKQQQQVQVHYSPVNKEEPSPEKKTKNVASKNVSLFD